MNKSQCVKLFLCDIQGQVGVVNSNEYKRSPMSFRMGKILQMQIRGSSCFDFDYYRHHSPDLSTYTSNRQIWYDFVNQEQFTGRHFRYYQRQCFKYFYLLCLFLHLIQDRDILHASPLLNFNICLSVALPINQFVVLQVFMPESIAGRCSSH